MPSSTEQLVPEPISQPEVNFLDRGFRSKAVSPRPRRYALIGLIFLLLVAFGCRRWTGHAEKATASLPGTLSGQTSASASHKPTGGFFNAIKALMFGGGGQQLRGFERDRINVLLLGMGGAGHDGPYLTDTILLMSIKPSAKQVAFVSIPRDLAVNIPGHGWYRVNSASAFGEGVKLQSGASFARDVVAETMGVPIDYYVRIDFRGFADLIDAVGGITVHVDRPFVDHQYPADDEIGVRTVSFTEGDQTMDGKIALVYARSRHGNNNEGSDFARAKRQQKMLLALKEKILSGSTLINPLKINQIWQTVETHLTTDMEFADTVNFMKLARACNKTTAVSLVLDASPSGFLQETTGANGAFLLQPTTGSFDAIRAAIENIFENPAAHPLDAPPAVGNAGATAAVEIQNGTWHAGLAARVKKRLEDANLSVTAIGNTALRPQPESGIYVLRPAGREAEETLEELKKLLHIDIKPPSVVMTDNGAHADILVIIGDDFRE